LLLPIPASPQSANGAPTRSGGAALARGSSPCTPATWPPGRSGPSNGTSSPASARSGLPNDQHGRERKERQTKTYTARLQREQDGRWSVELEEEPRVHTGGRTVDQALARVREATALWFQVDEASIELVPRPVLSKADSKAIDQARQARDQARSADRLAMDRTQKAVAALARRGVSMRDAAAILGISHQRVPAAHPRANPGAQQGGSQAAGHHRGAHAGPGQAQAGAR
jgi:predicted RNase H-like HicB family nuclease